MQMIYTYAIVLVGGIALLIWWSARDPRSRLARWLPLMLVAGAAVVFAAFFRVKGITGDWIPVDRAEIRVACTRGGRGGADAALPETHRPSRPKCRSSPSSRSPMPSRRCRSAAVSARSTGAVSLDGDPGTIDRGASFPRFLGPRGDSTLPDLRLARDWTAKPPRLLWRKPIGAGWSGFAVAGGRAVTLEQRGEMETVAAYDLATGDELWSHGDRAFFTNAMAGPGPRATPTIDGTRVFTFGSTGLLTAYDVESGRRLWQHDVIERAPCAPPRARHDRLTAGGRRTGGGVGGRAGRALAGGLSRRLGRARLARRRRRRQLRIAQRS